MGGPMVEKMFGAPSEGLPIVHRLGGSQTYHKDAECSRLKRPQKNGAKLKRPRPFDLEQAEALGWSPCAACSLDS